MSSNPSPLNSSRFEGCTLTGALSVLTEVRDAVCIVHGPAGCTHHNFSLLHATLLSNDRLEAPRLLSTRLTENDIIFGGEDALEKTIARALSVSPAPTSVFVLSTCIVETIGDDTAAVCAKPRGVPVVAVPTAGFLGGVFETGVRNALSSVATLASPAAEVTLTANLVGEKNLEYGVDENAAEIARLLARLGIGINLRFVRRIGTGDVERLGAAAVNILREPALRPVGEDLKRRFKTPCIESFPTGLAGTCRFLEEAGRICGVDASAAVEEERAYQAEMLSRFADIAGSRVCFRPPHPALNPDPVAEAVCAECIEALDLTIAPPDGVVIPLPYPAPVGTAGLRRMLHRWRVLIRGKGRG
ncbi:MAG: nitrogenase component 1 [Methanoculleus sp.]|uniref:nitrogenase component 1 n=1 Tax=Methanoculleus sp. TaxID=90427 RepID=UPI0025CFD007|nr:nitrogenase component 1 [Methanoculleus sp.]MCK9317915.1 nitrogenase component 1 [Methanoculleus sp.]MDD2253705.1 nitrogenase component 1 [Methanoculleus sp.]MDD3216978.1 nitrogenase component 1 [Methanoculleus sp.]MDD4314494.1 nitrogenase component 1 [Methanoculleus sp.]MDD4470731.1 nitrogenase component 1 [Methanoculleus sp.]